MPVTSSRLCPILVDRDEELAALRLALRATGSDSRVVLVTGEAGTGKSRLIRELLPYAREQLFQVLIGGCATYDVDFPFAPILDALRQYLSERSTSRPALTQVCASLADLLVEDRGVHGAAPEHEKHRRFEAVATSLLHVAEEQPLLIVLEDLHWADRTSLELLEVLSRRLHACRVVIVGTARTDEQADAFVAWKVSLQRARMLEEVSLEPLGVTGVARMLQSMLRFDTTSTFAAAVHERTEGNPFFVEELLAVAPPATTAGWQVDDLAVPQTVRHAVLKRLEGLGVDAQTVLNLAAVAGRRVSFTLLSRATGLSDDALASALEALVSRHILVEERLPGNVQLSFRHALTRDAVHERLMYPQRRALHGIVADALARNVGDTALDPTVSGALGYHFHAAERWEEAFVWARRAGEAARRVYATSEALTHYRRALDAAMALGRAEICVLRLRCGEALATLGAYEAGRVNLEDAIRDARTHKDPTTEFEALHALAGLYASSDYHASERLAREAVQLARTINDRRREGLALNRLGNVLANLVRFEEGRALHEDALHLFSALGDDWGSADCLDLIGMARYLAGEVQEARSAFGSAAAKFRQLGDTERAASSMTNRGLYLAVLDGPCATNASPADCRVDALEGLRVCREIGWRGGEAYATVALACADVGDGQYGHARAHIDSALSIARDIGHQQWTVIALLSLGILHADLLDDAGALAWFERALTTARAVGSAQWIERLCAWVARCHGRLGRVDVAAAALRTLWSSGATLATIGQRRACHTLAEMALMHGRVDEALALTDTLLLGASGPRPAATVLLRAEALSMARRDAEADATLLEARRLGEAYGPRSMLWRVAAQRARLWHDRNTEIELQERSTACAELTSIMTAVPDPALRAGFLQAPEVRLWATATGRQRTSLTTSPGGLTARERDITTCVARGLSNKEIAQALSVSLKTVEMHVSGCLSKLGFKSRAQLAGWAIGEGIVPAPRPQG